MFREELSINSYLVILVWYNMIIYQNDFLTIVHSCKGLCNIDKYGHVEITVTNLVKSTKFFSPK